MDARDAIRIMADNKGYSRRFISEKTGNTSTWLSSALYRHGTLHLDTLLQVADICDYQVVCISKGTTIDGMIVIDS